MRGNFGQTFSYSSKACKLNILYKINMVYIQYPMTELVLEPFYYWSANIFLKIQLSRELPLAVQNWTCPTLALPPLPRERRDVLHDFLMLFIELESLGKVVYIVGIPNRWSQRHQNLREMQEKISYINQRLKYILKGRYIALPTFTYREDKFERVFRPAPPPGPPVSEEKVHLRPQHYTAVAEHVLRRVNRDLSSSLTKPSKIQGTIDHFLLGHQLNNIT